MAQNLKPSSTNYKLRTTNYKTTSQTAFGGQLSYEASLF